MDQNSFWSKEVLQKNSDSLRTKHYNVSICFVITMLYDSRHVEEVYADDNELRVLMLTALNKYVGVDEELDREVRGRLKNLREGTAEWEIEYSRLINQMRTHSAETSL